MIISTVVTYERVLEKFINTVNPELKNEVTKMYSQHNKKTISHVFGKKGKENVHVGKLYRYLENMYYQNNPDAQSFADYKFDIDNKVCENVQEKLRSIVQAYLFVQSRNSDKAELVKKYLQKILQLIKIDSKTETNKLLTDTIVNQQKDLLIDFINNKCNNIVKKSKWWNFIGKDINLRDIDDKEKSIVLSEFYL